MLNQTFLLIGVGALWGCADLSSAEKDVVGTWQEESADTAMRYSFTADHELSICFPERGPCDPAQVVHGRWWIRGDNVVYKLDWTPFAQKKDVLRADEQTKPLSRFRDRTSPKVPPYFRRVDERI